MIRVLFGTVIILTLTAVNDSYDVIPKDSRVVCLFGSWTRSSEGSEVHAMGCSDVRLCTHVMFDVYLNGTDIIIPIEKLAEFLRFQKLKMRYPNQKLMVSVIGKRSAFRNLVLTPENLKTFVDNAVAFLKGHNLHGLDLTWKFPKERDRVNFSLLVKSVRTAFIPHKYLLSVVGTANPDKIKLIYDVNIVKLFIDFWNILTIDYHKKEENSVGFSSPINCRDGSKLCIDASVKGYVEAGLDSNKIVISVPFGGQLFILKSPTCNHTGCPISRETAESPQGYYMTFSDICLIDDNTLVKYDEVAEGPYIVSNNLLYNRMEWIGYEDIKSIRAKVQYGFKHELGGFFIPSLSADDSDGICGFGAFSLLHAIVPSEWPKSVYIPDDQNNSTAPNGDGSNSYPRKNLQQPIRNTDYPFGIPRSRVATTSNGQPKNGAGSEPENDDGSGSITLQNGLPSDKSTTVSTSTRDSRMRSRIVKIRKSTSSPGPKYIIKRISRKVPRSKSSTAGTPYYKPTSAPETEQPTTDSSETSNNPANKVTNPTNEPQTAPVSTEPSNNHEATTPDDTSAENAAKSLQLGQKAGTASTSVDSQAYEKVPCQIAPAEAPALQKPLSTAAPTTTHAPTTTRAPATTEDDTSAENAAKALQGQNAIPVPCQVETTPTTSTDEPILETFIETTPEFSLGLAGPATLEPTTPEPTTPEPTTTKPPTTTTSTREPTTASLNSILSQPMSRFKIYFNVILSLPGYLSCLTTENITECTLNITNTLY